MTKVGIYKLGFKPIGESELSDTGVVVTGEADERAISTQIFTGKVFQSIDQEASSIKEDLMTDENGQYYHISLKSVVRRDDDIKMAEQYSGLSCVMYAWTVDGRQIPIGSEAYPARMVTSDIYDGIATREVSITVEYDTVNGLLRS